VRSWEGGVRRRTLTAGRTWPEPVILKVRLQNNGELAGMIRKLKSGEYRLYSRKKNPKTGKRRNLGTFPSLAKAKEHERAVQFFKRH
jgi:hypothetical protein